ncbi:LamG domain-containing protein [Halohasta litorea]|uniref:LamG domain-containing protein n=1 Tax=Halohasta litorea TaxID=869891 RepID=A0ABD6D9F2_9EURY|nr:LamG domain-containing protein [Halohasta litorea]
MKRTGGVIRDGRSAAPVQTTLLIAVSVIVIVVVSAVALGYVDLVGQPTTVPAGSGECTYALDFDPRDVAGFAEDRAENARYSDGSFPCVLWLDATANRGVSPGDPVTEWRDRSSNEFDARPTGEAPEWAVIDGIDAIRFDGTANSSLRVDATPDAMSVRNDSGLTVTMLVYVIDKEYRNGGLYAIDAADDGDPAIELRQSDAPIESGRADEWWATPGPTPEITTDGEWAIITHTTDGEQGTLFVNGENLGTDRDGIAELGSEVRIGAAGSSRGFNGYVAELFVSNERLSAGNRNVVQCAMDAKHDDVVDLNVC